ncbi:LRR receptor-like serine threonine-protein kinase [Seminavis robusta]|uniref:LRR receptor-like serine threonine-protein kinase n=1 Tax=Seminavis robusta TaxID=568900 RepID=A0A9N8EDG7_9STRA|nr:LRR receptor-like serine threonine-protein kinase [Seminavis robusta]|eukprot:Sro917_g219860.1 LRR receptor-like serine threonine-protein kinase (931) ;mRNA; r:5908-9191
MATAASSTGTDEDDDEFWDGYNDTVKDLLSISQSTARSTSYHGETEEEEEELLFGNGDSDGEQADIDANATSTSTITSSTTNINNRQEQAVAVAAIKANGGKKQQRVCRDKDGVGADSGSQQAVNNSWKSEQVQVRGPSDSNIRARQREPTSPLASVAKTSTASLREDRDRQAKIRVKKERGIEKRRRSSVSFELVPTPPPLVPVQTPPHINDMHMRRAKIRARNGSATSGDAPVSPNPAVGAFAADPDSPSKRSSPRGLRRSQQDAAAKIRAKHTNNRGSQISPNPAVGAFAAASISPPTRRSPHGLHRTQQEVRAKQRMVSPGGTHNVKAGVAANSNMPVGLPIMLPFSDHSEHTRNSQPSTGMDATMESALNPSLRTSTTNRPRQHARGLRRSDHEREAKRIARQQKRQLRQFNDEENPLVPTTPHDQESSRRGGTSDRSSLYHLDQAGSSSLMQTPSVRDLGNSGLVVASLVNAPELQSAQEIDLHDIEREQDRRAKRRAEQTKQMRRAIIIALGLFVAFIILIIALAGAGVFSKDRNENAATQGWIDYNEEECSWYTNLDGFFADDKYTPYSTENKEFLRRAYNISGPCNDKGEVEALFLSLLKLGNSTLKPELPPELTLLSSLKVVALPRNALNGTLDELTPKEIYQMPSLRLFVFNYNNFNGTVPAELWQMTNLTSIEFARNKLTGTLPSQLGLMTNLRTLDFQFNPINGTIPTEIGMLDSLEYLWIAYSKISGPLPSEIGLVTSLRRLNTIFNNPGLSGALPPEVAVLPKLQVLELSGNSFNGSLPAELGQLTGLVKLAVDDNSFSGTVPSELGLLAGLQYLEMNGNSFSGEFPEVFTTLALGNNVTALQRLQLRRNNFSGFVPDEVCSLGDWDGSTKQGLAFDCNATVLCGCDFCLCPTLQNYTLEATNRTAANQDNIFLH